MIQRLIKDAIPTFFKGFLMGTCDVIPGISGGTIAFILGIYIRFITAVKNITPQNILLTLQKPRLFKKFEFHFLVTLLLGMVTAIFTVSRIVLYLLEHYQNLTLVFFVGLILASSKIVYSHIENHKTKDRIFAIVGAIIGIAITFLTPATVTNPSLPYIFFGGFIGISAMFLPGISGSFILLVFGIYEIMLSSLHNLTANYPIVLTFITGIVFGALFISRAISFLFNKDKSKTLYTLLGLIVGTLSVPIKNIYAATPVFDTTTILFIALFFFLGIIVVVLIDRMDKDFEDSIDDMVESD